MVPTPALVWWLRSRASSTISFSWTRPPARQSRCCRRTCPTRQTASSSVTRYVLVLAVVVIISNKLQFFDAHTHELNFLFCPMLMKATKDCDYWQTASFDTATSTLYYQVRITCSFILSPYYDRFVYRVLQQAHSMDESRDSGIYALQYVENKVTKKWYPVTWVTSQPMQFGYMGYQFVSITN